MKIALAQARSVIADVEANVADHLRWIDRAAQRGAALVVFPELSITGYEPRLAGSLALTADDARLDPLQRASDALGVAIAVGAPVRVGDEALPRIGVVWLRPSAPREIYGKQLLHPDELPFFAPQPRGPAVVDGAPRIGLAICYELSVPEHADAAFAQGAALYLATVAKTAHGVASAHARLAEIARRFTAPVLMVNCVGTCDGAPCTGGSAVWSPEGERLAQLDDREGLLVFDVGTHAAARIVVEGQ